MSLARILGVWLLILPLMIANGIIRETLFAPAIGQRPADLVSAILGIVIILGATRPFVRNAPDRSVRGLTRISAIWLVLTVAFEFIFGHYVDRKSWSELAGSYALGRGNLWPLVLASLVGAPFLWTRVLVRPKSPVA